MLDDPFRALETALTKVMMTDAPLRVDEVDRRPVLVAERPPDGVLAVDRHRVVDAHVRDRLAYVVDVLLELELRRVNADHHQAPTLVLLGPGAHVRQRAQPVDAGIGPEVDEDDLTAQARNGQRRRVEPVAGTVERGHPPFNGQGRRDCNVAVLCRGSARHADRPGQQSGQQVLGCSHDGRSSLGIAEVFYHEVI